MPVLFNTRLLLGAVLVAAAGPAAAADSDTAAEFFRGKTVNVIVGSSTGGGYDLNARILAQHIRKHIPGQPAVVVQNMPGAGGIKAANYIYSVAPKDGLSFAILQRNLTVEPLFTHQDYEGTKFTWLGSISKDVSTCISWKSSPIKSWADLTKSTYTAAGQTAGADADVFALVLKNLFGAKVKLVRGYPGMNEMALAMERSEVDGVCGLSYSTLVSRYSDWLKDKSINILVQAALQKDPALPNVPLLSDQTKDPETLQVLKLIVATQSMARPFMAPPQIPDDRKRALRTAFDTTMKDPEFIADATKVQMDVSPMTGAAIDTLLAELYATPKKLVTRAASAISDN